MNVQMLKYLVELSDNQVDSIDLEAFYKKFPNSPATSEDLYRLKRLGYISILDGDNSIDDVGVNQKALDYFK